MRRRRRRARNPGGLGLALVAAVVGGVGYVVYQHLRPTGEKAKVGDVVTVPFSQIKTDAPVSLDALGGQGMRLVVTSLGETMRGLPAATVGDKLPNEGAIATARSLGLEVPFARSGVVLIERGAQRIT